MSRRDFSANECAALDCFGVPPVRGGFAERIMASTTMPAARPALRDRRGHWKLARRAIIGTVAAGMVSAAAVASGLLGAAGIRVPVLTAMLAPEPVPVKTAKPALQKAARADPAPATSGSSESPIATPRLDDMRSRRAARRAERQAFLAQNPEVVPVIKQALQNERDFIAANPEIRALRRLPLAERKAYLAERPELAAALRVRQAERRAFRAANPETEALIRSRLQERRAARERERSNVSVEGNQEVVR